MSQFRSINLPGDDKTSPTTPRQKHAPSPPPPSIANTTTASDEAATPTRASFQAGTTASQKPLPSSPFPEAAEMLTSASQPAPPPEPRTPQRINSKRSVQSRGSDEMDVDTSPGERAGSEDSDEHSDEESKKKKQKKMTHFYCTGWANCNLSFTRSEHLARHIRKHTGERPFECHCKRTFSRLDNLRQHAQTVHLNEDIPPDSLAASGTRYQKTLARPSIRHGARSSRAGTGGSAGRPIRGHSKSLSTSSISSIGTVQGGQDPRRRPAPLVMADPQARLSFESYRPDGQIPLPGSPSDFGTPTSATFSTGQNSPRYGLSSPGTSHSHAYHARRLSVPSGGNMFMYGANSNNDNNNNNSAPYLLPAASMAGLAMNSSGLASPTSSVSSPWSRRDSVGSRAAADDSFRRRTWHPDTLAQFSRGTRLSQVLTPSQIDSAASSAAPPRPVNQDQPQQRPQQQQQQQQQTTLPSVQSLLRMVDGPAQANPNNNQVPPSGESGMVGDGRQNSGLPAEWDRSLHRHLNELDINHSPSRDGAGTWANETNQAVLAQGERVRGPATVRFNTERETTYHPAISRGSPWRHQHTMSAPAVNNMMLGDTRRQGWHNGPIVNRQPPETIHEGRPHVDRLEHPNLSHFSGFPARTNPPLVHQQLPQPSSMTMTTMDRRPPSTAHNVDSRGLDALVAAASSMEPAASITHNGRNNEMMVETRPDPALNSAAPGHYIRPSMQCHNCGRVDTPEWRHGPDGPDTLCYSCGLEYHRLETRRQNDQRFEARRFEQYVGRV